MSGCQISQATRALRYSLILCVFLGLLISGSIVFADENQTVRRRPIEYLGAAEISGDCSDLSGLDGTLENGVPHNRLGGISALEYTGHGNLYVALPDRGPDDGATGYACRYHVLDIRVNPGQPDPVDVQVEATRFFVDQKSRKFSGSSGVLEATSSLAGRLDPEGCRRSSDGTVYVSDEYGPLLLAFDSQGRETRRFKLPDHLLISHQSASKIHEITANSTGRVSNRGMEGLAISPDQTRLFGIMQSSLLQDGTRKKSDKVHGRYCRIVEVGIASGAVREFAYPMTDPGYGVSEILACGPDEFLVLERDSNPGVDAAFRQLVWIDLKGASDISSLEKLPTDHLPESVQPARRRPFLDFLSHDFPLAGSAMPEKIEGITFGPTLSDGRTLLLVSVDNDFEAAQPTLIWAFAVDPTLLNLSDSNSS